MRQGPNPRRSRGRGPRKPHLSAKQQTFDSNGPDVRVRGNAYQVLEKYLKSRKGRKLSLDDINHVAAVADSLAFTIEQMAKIDDVYKTAFPDRG